MMSKDILLMLDAKAIGGTFVTAASAASSFLEVAEPIVTILVTIIVGSLTAWYTWERATKLRRERKDNEKAQSAWWDKYKE